MSDGASIGRGRVGLLLMDLMPVLVPAFGGDEEMLARLSETAARARSAGVDVIHVRVAFRDGYPDVASTNKIFSATVAALDFTEKNPETEIHPLIERADSDIVVLKRRVSAFAGSDLELVLRSRGITRLAMAGVTTSGVVLSTLRAAADLDYEITVLADGCADPEPEVHRVLLENVFPAHAEVVSAAEWVEALDPRAAVGAA
jgi:nicotinamidase-related amidase